VNRLGIIVNPMSGRDVRRVTAKASTSSHHDKQQHVTRLVLGALAQGVDEIYLGNEPFRINERAVENLPERHKVKILNYKLSHTEQDTVHMVDLMWQAGCRVFIVLGGDGTSRVVAKARPDAIILPLSTGTNNVFPSFVEASVAGAAAGLIASHRVDYEAHCRRCKQIHITVNGEARDIALIDAVLLKNDHLGSFLPVAEENISQLFLTRAEPASVGMSPIGGYLIPCHAQDDFGVRLRCGEEGAILRLRAPISPGLYGDVPIISYNQLSLDETITFLEEGILAFDGDRSIKVSDSDLVEISIRRDGPWIIEADEIFEVAAAQHLLID